MLPPGPLIVSHQDLKVVSKNQSPPPFFPFPITPCSKLGNEKERIKIYTRERRVVRDYPSREGRTSAVVLLFEPPNVQYNDNMIRNNTMSFCFSFVLGRKISFVFLSLESRPIRKRWIDALDSGDRFPRRTGPLFQGAPGRKGPKKKNVGRVSSFCPPFFPAN